MRALDDVALVGHHRTPCWKPAGAGRHPWSEVEPDQPYLERLQRILTRKEYRILVRWTQPCQPAAGQDMKPTVQPGRHRARTPGRTWCWAHLGVTGAG